MPDNKINQGATTSTSNNKHSVPVYTNFELFDHQCMDWDIYKERLEQFFFYCDELDNSRKASILLTKLNHECFKLLKDLAYPQELCKLSYEDICKHLTAYYGKPVSVFNERRQFYKTEQSNMKTIMEWYSIVKKCASHCNFGAQLEYV